MVRLENVLDQGERPCRLHCRLQRGLISRLAGVFFFFFFFISSLYLSRTLSILSSAGPKLMAIACSVMSPLMWPRTACSRLLLFKSVQLDFDAEMATHRKSKISYSKKLHDYGSTMTRGKERPTRCRHVNEGNTRYPTRSGCGAQYDKRSRLDPPSIRQAGPA